MLPNYEVSAEVEKECFGRPITDLQFKDDALYFEFDYGLKVMVSDQRQSCCENRYMDCDDDLSQFIGATFERSEVTDRDIFDDSSYGCHEVQFLRIYTSKGVIVAQTHNEHNGYYGGFSVVFQKVR